MFIIKITKNNNEIINYEWAYSLNFAKEIIKDYLRFEIKYYNITSLLFEVYKGDSSKILYTEKYLKEDNEFVNLFNNMKM